MDRVRLLSLVGPLSAFAEEEPTSVVSGSATTTYEIAAPSGPPLFVETGKPKVAALATAAWNAAERCTRRHADAWPEVRVLRPWLHRGVPGRADLLETVEPWRDHTGQRRYGRRSGLARLTFERIDSHTVARTIAHAWVHDGPPALVEGAADLLADCISRQDPGNFPPPVRRRPTALDVDLLTWTDPPHDRTHRADTYDAAAELMRAVSAVLPARTLWHAEWAWPELESRLHAAGPEGEAIGSALSAGLDGQRALLLDLDGDAYAGWEEARIGADPAQRDTNGDHLTDLSPTDAAAGYIAMPVDGGQVCLGIRGAARGGFVTVFGPERPVGRGITIGAEEQPVRADKMFAVPAGARVYIQSDVPRVKVVGVGIERDPACAASRRLPARFEP